MTGWIKFRPQIGRRNIDKMGLNGSDTVNAHWLSALSSAHTKKMCRRENSATWVEIKEEEEVQHKNYQTHLVEENVFNC